MFNYCLIIMLFFSSLMFGRSQILYYHEERVFNKSQEIARYRKWHAEVETETKRMLPKAKTKQEKIALKKNLKQVTFANKVYIKQILERGKGYALKLAKARRAEALLESSTHVLWVNPKNDITDIIIHKLNKEWNNIPNLR